MKVQPIYNNKIFKRGLEFAADNSALFVAGASLALSTVVRPLSILAAPKSDKENKKLACAKSVSSSLIGYLMMLGVSLPLSRGVKRIDKRPTKYLKSRTIDRLSDVDKSLQASKGYQLATQTFKLGLGMLIAAPKAILTSALIPTVMGAVFHKKSDNVNFHSDKNGKGIAFKGRVRGLSETMGRIIDNKHMLGFVDKFKDTNFVMHAMAATDTLATGVFIHQTNKNPKIEENRKRVLNYNAAISTGLCIAGGYLLDKVLDKPTQKFIEKFSVVNKNSPKLAKYVEGIKIAKPALILGGIYYGIIPFVSTYIADRFDEKRYQSSSSISNS